MIKPSDINVSVYDNKKSNSYRPDTIIEARLELHEVVIVNSQCKRDQRFIEQVKEQARYNLYHQLYGDLLNSIEEMYALVMVKMPHCQELDMVREIKKKIDEIMRGGKEIRENISTKGAEMIVDMGYGPVNIPFDSSVAKDIAQANLSGSDSFQFGRLI